eukprot:3863090-Amphidinium_carterae.1
MLRSQACMAQAEPESELDPLEGVAGASVLGEHNSSTQCSSPLVWGLHSNALSSRRPRAQGVHGVTVVYTLALSCGPRWWPVVSFLASGAAPCSHLAVGLRCTVRSFVPPAAHSWQYTMSTIAPLPLSSAASLRGRARAEISGPHPCQLLAPCLPGHG